MSRPRTITDDDLAEYAELYRRGLSIRQLAQRRQVAYSTMHLILTQAGVKFRPPAGGHRSKEEAAS